jgi:hypothetical protein
MSIKTNIVDYLSQIEKLTSTNLQILKTINDSFFTKKNHLFAEIDDTTYVIPSFLSLENKINMLQENFENLVKAPETSEAYFNFDGNTRSIEVRKYSHVPDSLKLNSITGFSIDNNDVFKDFLTPVPYINLSLPTLPDDIVEVNVKKIIAKSDSLKVLFKNKLMYTETDADGNEIVKYHNSANSNFGDIYKLLLNYNEDSDYIEYDSIYKLPIRKNIGSGTYIIEKVISDEINNDLEELITLKLKGNLTYKLFDDTIEKPLRIGDELINYDGTGKVVIKEIRTNSNTIVVKVVNGEYLNFVGTESYDTNNGNDIHDLSKLRFHMAYDFETDKYIKVPLEEDQFVFIAVAAINSRMNVQSSWGTGLVVDAYSLTNNDVKFKTYYDTNVKNIGDVLLEMSNMITSPITSLSQDTFIALTNLKPVIPTNSVSVMQINKHLNNSATVNNIRDAYNQKKTAEITLTEIQTKINEINDKLSSISFNDTNGVRQIYTSQLTQYNKQKNELLTTINNAINSISLSVNSAEIPIENAKYRIRGFFVPNFDSIDSIDINKHVIGLQVQYRYKNISSKTGNAVSINSSSNSDAYIYSDWNVLNTKNKLKIATCTDGIYSYNYETNNEKLNEPSYNQIDIPISQGETVDIRVKVVYDFGQPYITMTSDWSEILNIAFPDEFAKDIPVLTIIEENNNDIETNRFNNILETNGINNHINDMIIDQNITYFHKPDNIASGFYTEERKIIPLKDKLQTMVNDIAELKSEIQSVNGVCRLGASIGNTDTEIYSDRENTIVLEPYSNFNNTENNSINGAYTFENDIVSTLINISIANTSENAIKLYSIFPGNRSITINNTKVSVYNKDNYCKGNGGVFIAYLDPNNNGNISNMLQTQNQFITFRINDVWTGNEYYKAGGKADSDNIQNLSELPLLNTNKGMVLYPYISSKYGLCINSDEQRSYITINPNEEVIIPLYCGYKMSELESEIRKTLSFDIRTSLYSDPINYSVTVIAKNKTSTQDRLSLKNKNTLWERLTNPLKYEHTIK